MNIKQSLFLSSLLLTNISLAKENKKLDTLTVTAQKTEQNIQEIPLSISAFDEILIEDRKIENVSDIMQYIPNFSYFQNGGHHGVINPSLRGISSINSDSSVSVPVIIDGIAISSAVGYNLALLDIERIEVLRGPQGTLYGAGAEAGAVNIITKKPSNQTSSKVGIELGSDNKQQYTFSSSGALVDNKLYIGIGAKYYKKDGFIKNISKDEYINDKKSKYGKINLRYTPNDKLDISLISSKLKREDGGANTTKIYGSKIVDSNNEDYINGDDLLNSLKIDYDLGKYKFESITTYRDYDWDFKQDFDFTQQTINHIAKTNKKKELTQELRLNHITDNYSWLGGIYGDDKTNDWKITYERANGIKKDNQDSSSKSIGLFTNLNYDINDKFGVVAGLRYDKSNKKLTTLSNNKNYESDFSEVSPKLSFEYKFAKQNLLYTTIAKGYNSGGFNVHASDTNKKNYDEEKLISYEIGLKTKLLEDKLVLNSAIYQMDIDNLQVQNYINSKSFYVTNAAKAKSKGFEVELNARVTQNINLFANYGYTRITFDNFNDAKGNYDGKYKPFSPKYNYSIGGKYRADNGYFARADLVGYGDMYLDNANSLKRDAYNIINAKIGYEKNNYEIYLYGKNIFDKDYTSHGFANGNLAVYSEPREVGVQLAYRF